MLNNYANYNMIIQNQLKYKTFWNIMNIFFFFFKVRKRLRLCIKPQFPEMKGTRHCVSSKHLANDVWAALLGTNDV